MKRMKNAAFDRRWVAGAFVCLIFFIVLSWATSVHSAVSVPFPVASGKQVLTGKSVTIDASNTADGYIMIKHKGSKKKLMVQIQNGDKVKATHELNGDGNFEVFSLAYGNGTYKVEVFQASGSKANEYTRLLSKSIKVNMPDTKKAFLYPNKYVNYAPDSETVKVAIQICSGLSTEEEKFNAIWDYISKNMVYDYVKAATVKSGYVPVVDDVLKAKTGICFDYAAVLATMLRVHGIPTQMVFGYLKAQGNAQYHAWNHVYLGGKWYLKDPTFPGKSYSQSDYTAKEYN